MFRATFLNDYFVVCIKENLAAYKTKIAFSKMIIWTKVILMMLRIKYSKYYIVLICARPYLSDLCVLPHAEVLNYYNICFFIV